MHELAGPGARRERRRVERLEPLARQDLATLDELAPRRAACSRGRLVLRLRGVVGSSGSSSAVGRRPSLGVVAVGLVAVVLVVGSLRRDRREGLGERVGQVAEDVGRVVELDEVVGAVERPPLAVVVLGDDLGRGTPVAERQPLVVVVDDERSPTTPRQAGRGILELLEQARPRLRWLRSWTSSARS